MFHHGMIRAQRFLSVREIRVVRVVLRSADGISDLAPANDISDPCLGQVLLGFKHQCFGDPPQLRILVQAHHEVRPCLDRVYARSRRCQRFHIYNLNTTQYDDPFDIVPVFHQTEIRTQAVRRNTYQRIIHLRE